MHNSTLKALAAKLAAREVSSVEVTKYFLDRVTEADQRELFQSIAPAVEDGLYLVPKVIE